MKLRVNYIGKRLHAQGPGVRYTIWTQGCSIHCPGCSNTDTWDFDKGTEYEVNDLIKEILLMDDIDGVTITGGEPLDQFESVYALCRIVQVKYSVFLTTGYSELTHDQQRILKAVDILCMGPFEQDKICNDGWRGSSNQVVKYLTERGVEQKKLPAVKKEIIISPQGNAIETGFRI